MDWAKMVPVLLLLWFSNLVCSNGDSVNITAEPGKTVILPCRAPINTTIRAVEYRRADLKPDYVFLHPNKSDQHELFKNRVELQDKQMKDGNVSLVLNHVTFSDKGVYECRVFYKEGNEKKWSISKITLTVEKREENKREDEEKRGEWNQQDSATVQKISITAPPGLDITLTCRVPNNTSVTVLHWIRPDLKPDFVLLYRDNKTHPDHQHVSFKNRVQLKDDQMEDGDLSLILKNVTVHDSGTYDCHVLKEGTNRGKRTPEHASTNELTVKDSDSLNITAEPGQTVVLPCRAPFKNNIIVLEYSRADLGTKHVFLHRDKYDVPDGQHELFQNRVELQDKQMKDGNVSLVLNNVTVNDTGVYKCHVVSKEENEKNESISTITLTVEKREENKREEEEKRGKGNQQDSATVPTWVIVLVVLLVLLVLGGAVIGGVLWYRRSNTNTVPQVEVDSGVESVLLPRKTNVPLTDDVTVEWTDKDNRKVHVYQNGSDDPEEQDRHYRGRTEMNKDLRTGDVSLTLKSPTLDDSGRFLCTISSNHGNALMKKEVELKVRVCQMEVEEGAESLPLLISGEESEGHRDSDRVTSENEESSRDSSDPGSRVQGPTEDIRTSSSSPDPTPLLTDSPVSSVGGSVPVRKNQE
ncbi:uncharacterized protein KZ484_006465 [Pholidichthys leucotaenia]